MIPRAIRGQAGVYGASEVAIQLDGAAIRIEPTTTGVVAEEDGRLVIPASGVAVTTEMVERLRDADRC